MATMNLATLTEPETTSPAASFSQPLLLLEAEQGAERAQWLAERLREAADTGARTFKLSCEFGVGGPWAGVSELFSELISEIQRDRPDLIELHGFELGYVLPLIRRSINLRGLTLTDLAPNGERTRNWARDRAFRNVHGLIDLLDEWKSAECPTAEWVIACDLFDDAGAMSSLFFRELMRRRAGRLHIRLIAAVAPGHGESVRASFDPSVPAEVRKADFEPCPPAPPMDSQLAGQAATELERRMGDDKLEQTVNLPRLIYLWKCAGRNDRLLLRQWQALDTHLELGQYGDAYRYSRGLLELAFEQGHEQLKYLIFDQTLVCHLTFDEVDQALQLCEEVGVPLAEGDGDRQDRLFYQMAMMYGRFKKPRDFAKGEEYLDRGLAGLAKSKIPEVERHFRYVFNRNGLAMIRNFQGRPDEALALCRDGLRYLNEHIPPDVHKLHRSILIYNMAQVCAITGAHEEALEHFAATIAMDPNYSEYYNDRGSLFLKLDRLEEAKADYLRAMELSPPYFEVFTNLGQCYRRMGNMDDAVKQYSRALDLEPKHVLALLGRGKAYEEAGERDAAIADYTAVLALEPTLWEALGSRAVLYYEAGRLSESLADFDAAIALKPDFADLHENRAVVMADIEKFAAELSGVS
jgi:tetratricopeptide (TPR) repeat protein